MPIESKKGRGATRNDASSRFNLKQHVVDGDWLDEAEAIDGGPPPRRTTVTIERPKTILTRNQSPDLGFDRSVNPYRGCEHGCIYCFARPTHAYHDLSPGVDFESRLFVKPDAAQLLLKTLSRDGYEAKPIALGTNTDPYQPIEGRWKVTRSILETLCDLKHPFTITTKSDRVLRDIDLIAPAARLGLCGVALSVTSLSADIHRTLEPRAPAARKRLAAIKALADEGVPVYLSVSPVVPHITDHEMEAIVEAGAKAGAKMAFYLPVRLPHEVAPLFKDWLEAHYPDRAGKVMATIRSLRGGRDNDPRFFSRQRGEGVWADLFARRFAKACRDNGIGREKIKLNCGLFTPPQGAQLRLI
ncbi:PA0069 family radical SAM protein [Sphingomicrobium sediminis]|uniref:PA0069 family radical SAM protein n=1 Tax=Sphingomicrobium sediminis TaxID=2950949 RepID=A0A9X2EF52_9SPHN|nr:PA0069 family radical SAM protein [Sphingomicrobium sediminis]MCM8556828.1 PA0069 family radical SAM protein [Sphingomicrobium sediminis]